MMSVRLNILPVDDVADRRPLAENFELPFLREVITAVPIEGAAAVGLDRERLSDDPGTVGTGDPERRRHRTWVLPLEGLSVKLLM